MALAFSSSDEAAIDRSVQTQTEIQIQDVHACFEVERCVQWIQQNKFKTVTLQFPDALMRYSPRVSRLIEDGVGQKVYILGDTSYGECCIDEVSAEHIGNK